MEIFKQYWPFFAIVTWFSYKWWISRQVIAQLPSLRTKGALFIDVRSPAEFAQASAPGTLNIPLQELDQKISSLPTDKPVVLCCASGTRSGMAKLLFKKKGFREVYNIGTWSNFLKA